MKIKALRMNIYLNRIDKISENLTHANRQVTDDAALNRLVTAISQISKNHPDLIKNFLKTSPKILSCFQKSFKNPDFNEKNIAFLIECYGIFCAHFENQAELLDLYKTFPETDEFRSSGLLRNAWVLALPNVFDFTKQISLKECSKILCLNKH